MVDPTALLGDARPKVLKYRFTRSRKVPMNLRKLFKLPIIATFGLSGVLIAQQAWACWVWIEICVVTPFGDIVCAQVCLI